MGTMPNLTPEKLNELSQTLAALAADADTNEKWTQKACECTLEILTLLPDCKDFDDPSLLEGFAKLAALSPDNPQIQQSLVHLVSLHIRSPLLFKAMREVLTSKDEATKELCYSVPYWWPESKENVDVQRLSSPFDFNLSFPALTKHGVAEIHSMIYNLAEILHCVGTIANEPQLPWNAFAAVISVMLRSGAHRDLVALVMCHDEKMINALHRLATLSTTAPSQQYAKFVLELLLSRPAVYHTLGAIHCLPGAKRLIELYTHQLHGAYEVAAKKPFQFVVDLLNQASTTTHAKTTTLVTCISIALARLSSMDTTHQVQAMYEEFNQISSVGSLLSLATQFGRVAAQFLLESYGDSTGTSKFCRSLNSFHQSSLPPLAKPNYFVSGPKPSPANETLATLMQLDEFDELHRSLLRILLFILAVITREVTQARSMMPSGTLADKIYMRITQPLYFFIMLVLRCNEKLDKRSFTAQATMELVVDIIGKLLRSHGLALAWTTLFDFATKASYNEVGTVRIWREFFVALRSQISDGNFEELIDARIDQFCSVFFPDSSEGGSLLNPYERAGQAKVGALARNEYMFLYQNLVHDKGDMEDGQARITSHYSMGRQQSVHVDKFGKERM